MKRNNIITLVAALSAVAVLSLGHAAGQSSARDSESVGIIADCIEAMGGKAVIDTFQTVRLEVIYPDHGTDSVQHEFKRPNLIRMERPGEYLMIFDGRSGTMLEKDPVDPGRGLVPKAIPAELLKGIEVDIAWFIPAFLDHPTEYAGTMEKNGVKCFTLIVTLPLGTRVTYLIDVETKLIKTIAMDETYEGQTFHMERDWLDVQPTQGILYPRRMTYPGRDGKTFTAVLKKIEINPSLDDRRFRLHGLGK
jgi:outer membrane lipoprotein-sorting protein